MNTFESKNYKKYFSYIKNDPNKEAIDRIYSQSEEDALDYFSERKNMSTINFLKIYAIGSE